MKYMGDFTIYSTKNGMLLKTQAEHRTHNFYEEEVNSFLHCVQTRERNRADIDLVIETSRIMQAIYDSSEQHREIVIKR